MALISREPVPARLFTSLFDTPTGPAPANRRFAPATDIVESDTQYILRADLPGVAEDDISVELDGNVLSISGSRTVRSAGEPGAVHRQERSSGRFRRSVRLPQGVEASAIEASFDRGVLEVTVEKPLAPVPHRVAVTAGRSRRPIEDPAAVAGDTSDTTEAGAETVAAA